MSWLSFLKKEVSPADEPVLAEYLDIPVLTLGAVLFPGGLLSLKLSEQKYLEMVADCANKNAPFGVCLALAANDSGNSAEQHPVGTLAHIESECGRSTGHLALMVRGGRRFRIHSHELAADGVVRARVELLAEPDQREVPVAQRRLLPLLDKVVGDLGVAKIPEPHHFDDAAWVGYRLTEVMPVQLLAKQKLLELDDPVSRLEILFTYLSQRKLLL